MRPSAALLILLAHAAAPAAGAPRPNVVLIFVDDLGYGDIGPFGGTAARTPNLDRLAAEGRRFTHFYATPVCSMSRACLMTGCYNARVSVPGVYNPGSKNGLHPDEVTVAEVLKGRGYATACVGKWHLGHRDPFLPTRQGFDSYLGIPYSNDMTIDPVHARFAKDCVFREGMTEEKTRGGPVKNRVPLMRGEEVVEYPADQSLLTRRYTEAAVKFVRDNKGGPFFLYLPHTMVHHPLAASEGFQGRSGAGPLGDAIEEIDWSVGEVLGAIKDCGIDGDTLVIFTSDNGPAGRPAGPLRGSKASTFEGGVREPCVMRWPGRIPAGTTCDRIAGNIDVLPTLAGLAGGTPPAGRVIDGRDISSLMLDRDPAPVRDVHLYYTGAGSLAAIRQGDWKLFLADPQAKGKTGTKEPRPAPAGPVLYNLKSDPAETTDVSAVNPEAVARLKAEADNSDAEIRRNQRPPGKVAD